MKRGFCCAAFSLLLAGTAVSAPLIQEGFDDYQTGVRPAGWTFNGCSADSDVYTSSGYFGLASPSIKLDATGDSITTAAFAGAGSLSFWVRGVSINPSSSLLIEEYYASAWGTVTDIFSLPTSGTTIGLLALNPSSSQLKFTYTKVAGNLGFDDVAVFEFTTTTTTTTTTVTTTTVTTTTGSTSTTTSGPTTSTTTTALTCDAVYEGFDDYNIGVRPAGWTFNGCSSDSDVYTSSGYFGLASPSIKLDATGDSITTAVFGPGCPYDLSFWIRGVSTGAGSSLLVEEFYASSWVPLTDIATLPTTGTVIGALRLNPSSAQVRFTYTKSSGNLAFDDFFLDPPPTPTPSASTTPSLPPTPSPTATPGKTPTPTPEG
ncbi:MAG TPA: hypothetical protein PLZ73_09105 [bacterium]|nr:hypothetical protein [bacterium]